METVTCLVQMIPTLPISSAVIEIFRDETGSLLVVKHSGEVLIEIRLGLTEALELKNKIR